MARQPRGDGVVRYPRLRTRLPPHLQARLQAAASVLHVPVDTLVEAALERHIADLSEEQRELIDRVAAETVMRTERD